MRWLAQSGSCFSMLSIARRMALQTLLRTLFAFVRRNLGRLRTMIDRINEA